MDGTGGGGEPSERRFVTCKTARRMSRGSCGDDAAAAPGGGRAASALTCDPAYEWADPPCKSCSGSIGEGIGVRSIGAEASPRASR